MSVIIVVTEIHAPVERVFDLARSIDLHVESAGQTGEKAIGARTSGLLTLGEEVTWRGRHFGVWQNLTSRITDYSRPDHFRDSMTRGAFRHMNHDHLFSHHRGVTVMRDVIEFSAPCGWLGQLAEVLILRRHLRDFLSKRNAVLKGIAESGNWQRFLDKP